MRVPRQSSQQLIHLLLQQTLTERSLWAVCCSGHHPSKRARATDLVELPSEAGAAVLPVPQSGRLRRGEIKELRHSPKATLGRHSLCCRSPTRPGAPSGRHWRPGPPRGWPAPRCSCPAAGFPPSPSPPSADQEPLRARRHAGPVAPGGGAGAHIRVVPCLGHLVPLSPLAVRRGSRNTHTVSELDFCQALCF